MKRAWGLMFLKYLKKYFDYPKNIRENIFLR